MGVTPVASRPALPPDSQETDPAYRRALAWAWSLSSTPRSVSERLADRPRKLARMRWLLGRLGSPERALPLVLVAGTKGKGSTVAMIDACLRAGGRRSGRLTSPHLVSWRERTSVDGQPISTGEAAVLLERVRSAVEALPPEMGAPGTFEVCVAFSLLAFAEASLDVGVVEVGVGGRWDATNVVEPVATAIAPVSFDHVETLGHSLTAIAGEKAGILRPGVPGLIAPQPAEAARAIAEAGARLGAPLQWVGRQWCWRADGPETLIGPRAGTERRCISVALALSGAHQRDNATLAVATVDSLGERLPWLRVDDDALRRGLRDVYWPGRLQVVSTGPTIVVDGAHNRASAEALRASVEDLWRARPVRLLVGMSAGKDLQGVLSALAPLAGDIVSVQSSHDRSAPPELLADLAREIAPDARVEARTSVSAGLSTLLERAEPDDVILATGSLFVVGEVLEQTGVRSA